MNGVVWEPFGPGWRRTGYVVPGFDCRVECKHEHKGEHGIHNDEWIYVVEDGECALSLRVGSGTYPPTVMHVDRQPPRGWDLQLHAPWTDDEDAIRHSGIGTMCGFIESGLCFTVRDSILDGEAFFRMHGAPAFEQPPAFWEALRAKAIEWIEDAKRARAQGPHLARCPTCAGRGVVEAEVEETKG